MIRTNQIHWAAGFLEGEGSFSLAYNTPQIQASQVQKQPLLKLASIFKGNIHLRRASPNPKRSPIYNWSIHANTAAAVMMTLYPLMSPNRQQAIKKTLNQWRKIPKASKYSKICKYDHPFTPTNTTINTRGYRQCKTCNKVRNRRQRLNHPHQKKRNYTPPNQLKLFT